jgi:hypothetical protein
MRALSFLVGHFSSSLWGLRLLETRAAVNNGVLCVAADSNVVLFLVSKDKTLPSLMRKSWLI